jgi:hypothetical protein
MISLLDIAIRIALVIATGVLFSIIFLAYWRIRNKKLLFISIGFGIFFAEAIYSIPQLFLGTQIDQDIRLLLHIIVLVFILIGTLKD